MSIPPIILTYLKELSNGKWQKFKEALCNTKPPGEEITMENLKNKSKKRVVELIFKCYDVQTGTEKIKKILKDLKESNLNNRMQRKLRDTSKKMRVTQVPTSSKDAPPDDATVSSSEPPAKKRRQEDRNVPGPSHNTGQNVPKMGRPSPAQKEPKQGTLHNVQQNANKKGEPKPAQGQRKQEIPNLSEIVKNPLELFKEVEVRPALYNRNNPGCSNQEVKKKLWEEVASKVVKVWKQLDPKAKEETIKLLRKKWRNFADTFRREYKQASESTSSSSPSKNTNYRYYEHLKFLECRMDQRQTSSNPDGEQDDMQPDYENDDCREKKNQAAAKKTKESEQVLQTVSEVSSQGTSQSIKKTNNKTGGPAQKQGTLQNIENYFNKTGGPAPKQGRSQSEKDLPSITVEELKKIMVTCLKAQNEYRKKKFQETLCKLEHPENGEIDLEELKDKSEEDVADIIISRHTMKHAKNTFIKCLEKIKDNQAKQEFTEKIEELQEQKKKASKPNNKKT